MGSYVPDGYTREGYIAAATADAFTERLYDELVFTYRPASRIDVVKVDAEIRIAARNQDCDALCAVRAEQIACRFVVDHLVDWSLKDVGLHPVAVSVVACERMQPFLFSRLYNIIRGVQANDVRGYEDPRPSDREQLKN